MISNECENCGRWGFTTAECSCHEYLVKENNRGISSVFATDFEHAVTKYGESQNKRGRIERRPAKVVIRKKEGGPAQVWGVGAFRWGVSYPVFRLEKEKNHE